MSIMTRNFARITKKSYERLNKIACIKRALSSHSPTPFRKGQVLLFFFVSSL